MSGDAVGTLVAPPMRGCRVCELPSGLVKEINAAIWDGAQERIASYVDAATRIAKANDVALGRHSIVKHANHTEDSWRWTSNPRSLVGRERPVFPIDYESVTSKAASVGMLAFDRLEQRVAFGYVEDRDLIGIAKLGVGAAVAKQRHVDGEDAPASGPQLLGVLFGVVSGHLTSPDGEIKVVTPTSELRNEFEEERRALVAYAAGDEEDAQPT